MVAFLTRTLLLILLPLCSCYGQQFRAGFIRTLDGRDLAGLVRSVKPPAKGRQCGAVEFKETETDSVRVYDASEIAGYGVGTDDFYNAKYIKECDFVLILTEGPLTLLVRNGRYFIHVAATGEYVYLPSTGNDYLRALRDVMKSCPLVRKKSRATTFDRGSLKEIIAQYNDCVKESTPNYKGLPPQVAVSVMAGYDYSPAKFADDAPEFLRRRSSLSDVAPFTAGIDLTLRKNTLSTLFGLYLGCYYSADTYHQFNVVPLSGYTLYEEFEIRYHELRVPIALEFRPVNISKLPYFVRAGTVLPAVINLNTTASVDAQFGNDVFAEHATDILSIKKKPQLFVGAGLEYQMRGAMRVRVAGSFSTGTGIVNFINDAPEATVTFYSYTVLIGLAF